MPEPVSTIAAFLDLVRRSGLVDDAQLEEAVADWPNPAERLTDELVQTLVERELLTSWQADQLRKGRHKGFMLGKYRLLKLLGAGGMSSVYLAENTTLRGKVAIKVLPRKFTDQTSYLARFEREAQAAWRLSHPNIVRAFDLERAGGIHYIPMEYVDGVDLHAKVKQEGPLPVEQAVDYVRQTALGLQHAHEEGLVHRDIKPANLILDKKGVVKILDLGLAAAKSDEGSLTEEHNEKVLGTADYLAPEQAKNSHQADARSDIYSLGCTLHYLLVAAPPFASGTLSERIRAHAQTPPPNIVEKRPDVPPAIAELYFRMMSKNPQARPQAAGEIAEQLGVWLKSTTNAGVPARPALPRRSSPQRAAGRGPGSGAGGSTGDSGAIAVSSRAPGSDAGPFAALTPPPSSPSRATLPLPQPPRPVAGGRRGPGSGSGGASGSRPAGVPAGFSITTEGPQDGQKTSSAKPQPPGGARPRKPFAPLGLPLGFWIALIGGLALVSVLGGLLWLKVSGGRAESVRPSTNQPEAGDPAETAMDGAPPEDEAGEAGAAADPQGTSPTPAKPAQAKPAQPKPTQPPPKDAPPGGPPAGTGEPSELDKVLEGFAPK